MMLQASFKTDGQAGDQFFEHVLAGSGDFGFHEGDALQLFGFGQLLQVRVGDGDAFEVKIFEGGHAADVSQGGVGNGGLEKRELGDLVEDDEASEAGVSEGGSAKREFAEGIDPGEVGEASTVDGA